MVNLSKTTCLLCVYISPTKKRDYDAELVLWNKKSEYETGLDPILFEAVQQWIDQDWSLQKFGYSDREIGWEAWRNLPVR